MQQTYILGRGGDQPFEIEPSRRYVHAQHARLTVDTSQQTWLLEDLKQGTGNGVYLRDTNGDFRRVVSCRIRPTDVVRLGPENANSFTFMAAHVLNPDNYNYEFAYMRHLDKKFAAEEQAQTAVNRAHTRNTIILPSIAALLTLFLRAFTAIDWTIIIMLSPVMGSIPLTYLRYKYRDDAERLKSIKGRRAKFMQCPKCWRPLSEYDLRNGRCSVCKAM